MKKIATLLFVSLLLVVLPANIFAEDQEVNTDTTVTLTAAKVSTYTVKLPRSFDVSNNSSSFDVFVKGDISSDKELTITCTQNHSMADVVTGSNRTVALTVAVSNGTFGYSELPAAYSNVKASITISHDTIPAGSYSYNLPVAISLADATA